ncbi:MAG: prephenate/arogenate dehydrogenase family protein [Pseudomonadota bacterium]
MTADVKYDRVAIIGMGLIGSSIARALRELGAADEIHAYDQHALHLEKALALGLIDAAAQSLASAVSAASLVVIATPVGVAAAHALDASTLAPPDGVVIDVGSVKGPILEAARRADPNGGSIVPCHPIAGTEQSGPEAGFASLFRGRWCVITPLDRPDDKYRQAVERATAFWRLLGSEVEVMDAGHHDLALAATSHLPHLIAFTMMGAVDDLESVAEAEVVKYSAGGFRDFTRIAASNPVMWRDVFLTNKEAVLEVLGRFTEELALLQRAIRWGDAETLEKSFARGRALRRAIVDAGQEKDVPNFGRDD